jgi:hypothetical protein
MSQFKFQGLVIAEDGYGVIPVLYKTEQGDLYERDVGARRLTDGSIIYNYKWFNEPVDCEEIKTILNEMSVRAYSEHRKTKETFSKN